MKKFIVILTILLISVLLLTGIALAKSEFASQTGKACTYCHNSDYTLNSDGQAFRANGFQLPAAVITPAPAPTPQPTVTTSNLATIKVTIKKDPKNTVRAIKIMKAPNIDAKVDNVWKNVKAFEIKNNNDKSKIYIKALYDTKNVYFLIKYSGQNKSLYLGQAVKDTNNKFVMLWRSDKKVKGYFVYKTTSDGADITAKSSYSNGMWITEIKRPLTTTSDKDVQFKNLAKLYPFAFSGFDNSQIGHAMQTGVSNLRFVK